MAKKKKNAKGKSKKTKFKKEIKGSLIDGILSIYNLYERKLDRSYHKFDLSSEQYLILQILDEGAKEGLSLKQIRSILPNHTSNTTRLVEKLYVKKFVKKRTFRQDKRQLRINLSSDGIRVLNKVKSKIEVLNSRLNSVNKAKNAKVLVEALNKISSALKA